MKTLFAISIMTALLTVAVVPGLQEAFALKADNSEKLSPKAFGKKTINAQCGEANCFSKVTSDSEHPSKIAKKIWSDQRIDMFMSKYLQTLGTALS